MRIFENANVGGTKAFGGALDKSVVANLGGKYEKVSVCVPTFRLTVTMRA